MMDAITLVGEGVWWLWALSLIAFGAAALTYYALRGAQVLSRAWMRWWEPKSARAPWNRWAEWQQALASETDEGEWDLIHDAAQGHVYRLPKERRAA